MKLLHITATHLEKYGGVPAVLYDLLNEQNKIDGFESRLLSVKAKCSSFDSPYFDFLKDGETVKNYIEDYEPDLVIIHSFFYVEYELIGEYLWSKGIHYYIEPHGAFGKAANEKSNLKKKLSYHTIFRMVIKHAYGFIFLNDAELNDSIFRTEHDLVIPNGINTIKSVVAKKDNKPTFYYLGRYDIYHKGLDCLMKALRILDKKGITITFDFFGVGSKNDTKYINDNIKAFKNINAINHAALYAELKEEFLTKAGIMVLTSRYEGFPMAVLEALSHGSPCLVTPGTNVKDIIEQNKLGWVCDFNPQSVADTIIRASRDYSSHANSYAKKCQMFVNSEYQWCQIAMLSYYKLKNELE